MSRVAILGSCITRDLWPIGGDATADLLYISRTSLPSLFSPPVRGFVPADEKPAGLGRHQHRAVVWDLQKTALEALVAHQPTHVIFDFIDERFDLLQVDGALASHSWELEESGYLAQPCFAGARAIPRLSAACERLWMDAVNELAAFLWGTPLSKAVFILHQAQWAEFQVDAKGARRLLTGVEIMAGRPAEIAQHNALLDRYEAAFLAASPHVMRVAAPDLRIADGEHRWGLSPFHYVPAYYDEIWRQLHALGV